MSRAYYCAALVIVAAAVLDAARIPSTLYTKQNKVIVSGDSGGKAYPPYISEWINMSIRNDPIIKVPIGGVLELECEAVGSPPPSVQWYHRKNVLLEAGFPQQNEIINTAIGKVKSRLVIDCIMPHHQGSYTCSGSSGSKKKILSPVNVLVEENDDIPTLSCDRSKPTIPRIVTWGPTLLEFSDRDVILPCSAIGNPTPEIYWINNKNTVIDVDTISSHYKILENGDLLITQISWEDMGTYTCTAQNSLGQDKVESFVYPVKKED